MPSQKVKSGRVVKKTNDKTKIKNKDKISQLKDKSNDDIEGNKNTIQSYVIDKITENMEVDNGAVDYNMKVENMEVEYVAVGDNMEVEHGADVGDPILFDDQSMKEILDVINKIEMDEKMNDNEW